MSKVGKKIFQATPLDGVEPSNPAFVEFRSAVSIAPLPPVDTVVVEESISRAD